MSSISIPKPLLYFGGLILLVLLVQAVFPKQAKPFDPKETATTECVGTPIQVPYEYKGTVVEPWSCRPQCDDQKQHYLVYVNGIATQCEMLPGCNDWGEDRGETCKIPGGNDAADESEPSDEALMSR